MEALEPAAERMLARLRDLRARDVAAERIVDGLTRDARARTGLTP